MKTLKILILSQLLAFSVMADEGMWIPALLGNYPIADMQKNGLKLTAEDIYNVNGSSLKDAIVLFGRGCTGAVVSDEGLLLTNHHCGFGQIQSHSTVEHDYLTDGFWAMSRQEELVCPGLTVSFLVRMDDVTDKVLEGVTEDMKEEERNRKIGENSREIIEEAKKDTQFEAVVRPLYEGNQYFIYVMEIFKDVRLVGAPPAAIGNFGADTDNWVWPRHTGDFSIFRIYADKENKPAEYSAENVPYRPKKHFQVTLDGVKKGDFTMVYGFPGSTDQYLPAFVVDLFANVLYPQRIKVRDERLEIIIAAMESDPATRIKYASKRSGIANAWKKWIGVNTGLRRVDALDAIRKDDDAFRQWANQPGSNQKYAGLLDEYQRTVEELLPMTYWIDYYSEAIASHEMIGFSGAFLRLANLPDSADWSKDVDRLKSRTERLFKDYDLPTDKKLMKAMLELFAVEVGEKYHPDIYLFINKKFGGDISAYVDWLYEESFMVTKNQVLDFLDQYSPKKAKKIKADPMVILMSSFLDYYTSNYQSKTSALMSKMDSLQRQYMAGIMEMKKGGRLYPDANGTLRITYGSVQDYFPMDGARYDYVTTIEGIMEKDDPGIYDYNVPEKLKELYRAKDYGPYGLNGTMPVCFIATNHTSGGNSGSPVLNERGELLGLNFDRNWEGTMSDFYYDSSICRNITLDIRYCLFIIDKFAGAGHLVQEMKVKTD